VGEVGNGVERPASPGVVAVTLLVEDAAVGSVGKEVDQPVSDYADPEEPERYVLTQMGLELN
jgi:hypothetical protein